MRAEAGEGARSGRGRILSGNGTEARSVWARRAVWLVSATMAAAALEAGLSVWAGTRAGSVALVGFGIDSVIEMAAGGLALHRLRLELGRAGIGALERAEGRIRGAIGITFFALAVYVVGYAGWTLLGGEAPAESLLGVAVAVGSLLFMPLLAAAKLRAAGEIGSGALRAEARETLACAYLSACLLVGLGANALFGWGWADPAAALLMVPWLVREGLEALEGDDGVEDRGEDAEVDGGERIPGAPRRD